MAQAITQAEVARAAGELARMRGSLVSWLRFRTLNDKVLAGQVATRRPLPYAKQVIATARDPLIEQDLATKLHVLLSVVMRGQALPDPDLHDNPSAAVELANIAIAGGYGNGLGSIAGGIAHHPLLWPALIVGGLLITITTAIRSTAEVAMDREEKACIQAGACTDYGFWLKAGGVVALVWFAWREMGGKEWVNSLTRRGRS